MKGWKSSRRRLGSFWRPEKWIREWEGCRGGCRGRGSRGGGSSLARCSVVRPKSIIWYSPMGIPRSTGAFIPAVPAVVRVGALQLERRTQWLHLKSRGSLLKFRNSKKHAKFEKVFLMVLTNQLIYLVNVKTMRKIFFSNYVFFSKSPNFTWKKSLVPFMSNFWGVLFHVFLKY